MSEESLERSLDVTHEELASARKQIGKLQKELDEVHQLNAGLFRERDEWRTKANWYLTEKERLERLLSSSIQESKDQRAYRERLHEELNLAQSQLNKLNLIPNQAKDLLGYIENLATSLPGTGPLAVRVDLLLRRNKELEQELNKLIKANDGWQKRVSELTEECSINELKLASAARVMEVARERLEETANVGKTMFLASRVAWHLGNGCDTTKTARELALAEWSVGVLGESQ